MTRWGQEESKTKGLLGCSFGLFLLGIFCYTFYINYDALEKRSEFEKRVQAMARVQHEKEPGQLIKKILDEARAMDLDISEENIDLTITRDENFNIVVDYWIDIPFTIDFLVTQEDVSLPIAEKVTVIAW
ncbi:hypothetical protein [Acanthopleuribacter pedis]|uniref:Transmembrane protein n=1 Tax=Acanthopleuribacter pedis TaxID=442870 RepID=A0A8J7QAF0_9BACT|nr:hypothetical protein [Acanthopleuribacter pedis]MBO1317156.1 hypothetical protein [Acanthopleuribacter pedis]